MTKEQKMEELNSLKERLNTNQNLLRYSEQEKFRNSFTKGEVKKLKFECELFKVQMEKLKETM